MSTLADLKRAADATATASAACPDEAQMQRLIADAEAEKEELATWARRAELAKEHGGTYPRPDPQRVAAAASRLASLRHYEPVAEMKRQLCRQAAHEADRDLRRAAFAAMDSGPVEDARREFQEAFQLMWNKGLALAGHEHAAAGLFDQDRYGPIEPLFKKINDIMWRDKEAHALRPAWMPLTEFRPRNIDAVAKAEASALAWLDQEVGA